jgi:hypothetical protein
MLGESIHAGQGWGTLVILGGVILGLGRPTLARGEATPSPVARVDWQARAEAAERRAGEAEAMVKAGLLPQLARLLRTKLVMTLVRQRRELVAVQETGARRAEDLERRLASLQEGVRHKPDENAGPPPTPESVIEAGAPADPAAAAASATRRNPLVQRPRIDAEPVHFKELLARRREVPGASVLGPPQRNGTPGATD